MHLPPLPGHGPAPRGHHHLVLRPAGPRLQPRLQLLHDDPRRREGLQQRGLPGVRGGAAQDEGVKLDHATGIYYRAWL